MEVYNKLVSEYDKIKTPLIGQKEDLSTLRELAKKCNESSKKFNFKVDGTDSELLASVKSVVDAPFSKGFIV